MDRAPYDLLWQIFMGFNFFHLRSQKRICANVRNALADPFFIRAYNAQTVGAASLWHFTYVRSRRPPRRHLLKCVNERTGRRVTVRIRNLDYSTLKLIYVWKSLFLFRDGTRSFHVYNLWTCSVTTIVCPFTFDAATVENATRLVENPDNDMLHILQHVHHVCDRFRLRLRVFCHSQPPHPDYPRSANSNRINLNELTDAENTRQLRMIIPREAEGLTLLVSRRGAVPVHVIQEDQLIYAASYQNQLPQVPLPFLHNFRYMSRRIYCNEGYLAFLETWMHRWVGNETCVRLKFFHLRRDLVGGYRFLSSMPQEHFPQDFRSLENIHLRKVEGYLNMTMLTADRGVKTFCVFRYNIRQRRWEARDGVIDVGLQMIAESTFSTMLRISP